MAEVFSHKGYEGSIEASVEGKCFHGRVLFVADVVTYEGASFEELERAFREAVEDYLAFCAEIGKSPEKPCKGQFNVRVSPEAHRALMVRACHEQRSLNEVVVMAIEQFLSNGRMEHHHLHEHVVTEHRGFQWTGVAAREVASALEATASFDPTADQLLFSEDDLQPSYAH